MASEKKASDSSYYFFKTTPKEQAEAYKPKKLDAKEATALQQQQEATAASTAGHSAWNTAGTWEDKHLDDWAADLLKDSFQALVISGDNHDVALHDIKTEGTAASIVYVRNKKKIGYDIQLESEWKGNYDGESVKGKCVINFDDIDQELCLEVTCSSRNDQHQSARQAIRSAKDQMQAKIDNFIESLRNYE